MMGAETLQKQLWTEMRIRREVEECQQYLDGFFEMYPGVQDYIDETKAFTARNKFSWTFTGRRRRFPILSYASRQTNRVSRQAVNARIQASSSDLVQTNMIDIDREVLVPNGGSMLLGVHDSMGFLLPEGMTGMRAEFDRLIVQYTAEKYPWLPVIWKYDVGKGPDYGNTHHPVD